MLTLGINAAYHDPAACIVRDGKVIAAAEEERFTHVKHGKRPVPFTTYELPYHAIDYCLRAAKADLKDVDFFGCSYDPGLFLDPAHYDDLSLPLEPNRREFHASLESPWDPLFLSYILNAPRFLVDGVPHHLEKRWRGAQLPNGNWHFLDHHLCHAASAYHASPFDEAAVLTLDGRGERAATTYSIGRGGKLDRIKDINMPHSLGMLYENVTDYLGFLRSSDEYKVMALASYGKPVFEKEFREIVEVLGEGDYRLNELRLEERLGPARMRGGPLLQRHFDIARSLQKVLEDTVEGMVRWFAETSDMKNLCMAGGVALNCVLNAHIRDTKAFDKVWVQPAAGDAGTALGAALWIDAQQNGYRRAYRMEHALLGPAFDDEEVESFLKWCKLPYRRAANVAEEAASLLAEDKVLGWFQGGMEFGPRALGARSILASPIHPEMQNRLNEIKDREDFRPVAPMVLEEDANEWFEDCDVAPYMLFTFRTRPGKEDRIPAVRHVDGTARVQTVNESQNPACYALLKAFKAKTGVGVLVNTSFNTRGEPIVCTPRDAVESFLTSPLDALVIGPFILEKGGQSH